MARPSRGRTTSGEERELSCLLGMSATRARVSPRRFTRPAYPASSSSLDLGYRACRTTSTWGSMTWARCTRCTRRWTGWCERVARFYVDSPGWRGTEHHLTALLALLSVRYSRDASLAPPIRDAIAARKFGDDALEEVTMAKLQSQGLHPSRWWGPTGRRRSISGRVCSACRWSSRSQPRPARPEPSPRGPQHPLPLQYHRRAPGRRHRDLVP